MTKHLHKLKVHAQLFRAHKEWVFAAVLVAVALLATSFNTQKPFASSEVQFTDPSVRGLAIVPASCPSTPHDSEVCDVAVSNSCSLSATSDPITAGQSTILQWSVTQPSYLAALFPSSFSGNISPSVGAISTWSGSTAVTPSLTTTYVLNGTIAVAVPWFGTLRTGSTQCQTTVTVQALNCPAGTYAYNGSCVASCPAGYYQYNGSCVGSCPVGYVPDTDGEGNDICTFDACPSGYEQEGSQCVSTAPACTPVNYCVGTTLWHRDAECTANPIQACSSGCTAGACIGTAAPGVVVWQVRPPLVASGDTVNVNWQVTDVRSCEVTGNNGDAWSGASGAQISSPITAQTIYTLTCIGLDDSTVTRSATVNITPIFQEL